jgi:hypothetical protein
VTAAETMSRELLTMTHRGETPPCATDPEPWVSEDRAERTQAVGLCQLCPLLGVCSDLAAEIRPSFGVWAAVDHSPRPLRGRTW